MVDVYQLVTTELLRNSSLGVKLGAEIELEAGSRHIKIRFFRIVGCIARAGLAEMMISESELGSPVHTTIEYEKLRDSIQRTLGHLMVKV